jgi:hypothetical protein
MLGGQQPEKLLVLFEFLLLPFSLIMVRLSYIFLHVSEFAELLLAPFYPLIQILQLSTTDSSVPERLALPHRFFFNCRHDTC